MTATAYLPLLALVLLPIVGGILVAVLPRDNAALAKQVALVFSVLVAVLGVAVGLAFEPQVAGTTQLVTSWSWIPAWGVSFSLGVDGISLVLILMTVVLVPVCILAGWLDADEGFGNPRSYFAWILVLEGLVLGVFAATDVFLFYVLFEAMLVPMYFLIGRYGGAHRQYAAVKFFLYSLAGGLLMLAALVGLYVVSVRQLGAGTFDRAALVAMDIDPVTQRWLFLGFFIAFAIKAPLWPLHTWLPDAAAEAPPSSSVLLVGVLDKVGTYGMLALCLPLFPDASKYFTPGIIVLSIIGIIYGALLAIGQTDLKRLIAYTSVSHFGFIALGIFAMTSQGQSGATLYMVNHGFSIAALFLLVGFMAARRGSRARRRLRRRAEGGSGPGRAVPPRGPVLAVLARAELVRLGVPRPGRNVHPLPDSGGHRDARHRARRALHPADVPAHHDRPGGAGGAGDARPAPPRGPRPRPGRGHHHRAGVLPQPALDVINPSVDQTMTVIGSTDPVPAVAESGK